MDPQKTEREREANSFLKAILEEVRITKEYTLEVKKDLLKVREDLRNLENLRPLRKEVTE